MFFSTTLDAKAEDGESRERKDALELTPAASNLPLTEAAAQAAAAAAAAAGGRLLRGGAG